MVMNPQTLEQARAGVGHLRSLAEAATPQSLGFSVETRRKLG